MSVIVRNSISQDQYEFEATPGTTVHEFVGAKGIMDGAFSVRDGKGIVIDSRQITEFEGQVISTGLPGETVEGGTWEGLHHKRLVPQTELV